MNLFETAILVSIIVLLILWPAAGPAALIIVGGAWVLGGAELWCETHLEDRALEPMNLRWLRRLLRR